MLDINTIYNIPCEQGFEKIDDKSIPLTITDPPFNIADSAKVTKQGNVIMSTQEAWGKEFKDAWDTWEEYEAWILKVTGEILRVTQDGGSMVIFLGRKETGLFAHLFEKQGWTFKNKLYFFKNNPLPHVRKNNYRSCVEEALWLSKGKPMQFNFISQQEMKQVFTGNIGKKATKHPTEKYGWMINPLIERHSNEGDLIFDPFMGSGSTAVYALAQGRNFIGFEKNKVYFDMASERIEKAMHVLEATIPNNLGLTPRKELNEFPKLYISDCAVIS